MNKKYITYYEEVDFIKNYLFKEGKKSISDVAYSLGFTANYFTRVYKNVYGITPRKSIESVYDIFEK